MTEIQAAGGIVVDLRRNKPKYLVVHRPDRDEWTFAHGSLRPSETHRDAAFREVLAQTGYECEMLGKLDAVGYDDKNDESTAIRYLMMSPMFGRFQRNDTVDVVVWMKRSQAMTLLSHVHDQRLLAEAHMSLSQLRRANATVSPQATTMLSFSN